MSDEEAQQIMDYDKRVEKSKDTDILEFDLTGEAARDARKFAHTGTRKTTAYKFTQRERKSNPTKEGIISEFAAFLENGINIDDVTNVEVTNKGREIMFKVAGKWYSVTLTYKSKMNK